MNLNRTCRHCNKLFENIDGKIFANHVRWCDKNPKDARDGSFLNLIRIAATKRMLTKHGEVKEFKVKCVTCHKEIVIKEREKDFSTKEKYFCSRICANTKIHSNNTKLKIKNGLIKSGVIYKKLNNICIHCKKSFISRFKNNQYCSEICHINYRE